VFLLVSLEFDPGVSHASLVAPPYHQYNRKQIQIQFGGDELSNMPKQGENGHQSFLVYGNALDSGQKRAMNVCFCYIPSLCCLLLYLLPLSLEVPEAATAAASLLRYRESSPSGLQSPSVHSPKIGTNLQNNQPPKPP
jgi:hypothetical protein